MATAKLVKSGGRRPTGAPAGPILEVLEALTRCLFASRRKTIRNNLVASRLPFRIDREEALKVLVMEGIDPGMRAEELAPSVFVRAAKKLAAYTARNVSGS